MTNSTEFQVGSSALNGVEKLSVGICKTGPNQLHIGFVYRKEDRSLIFCHLAWHLMLHHEEAQVRPTYAESDLALHEVALDRVNRDVVVAFLEQLKADASAIPYGFDVVPPVFDHTGRYIAQKAGKGLTCATFIIEIYRHLSFPLIIEESWPHRDEDREWKQIIINMLSRSSSNATAEHIAAIRGDTDAVRFRPSEVAAAAIQTDPPVTFNDCVEEARKIEALCYT